MAFTKEYLNPFIARIKTISYIDYVKNGEVNVGADASSILISAESDLQQLEGYSPGSIAHTAGYKRMWELSTDGVWTEL